MFKHAAEHSVHVFVGGAQTVDAADIERLDIMFLQKRDDFLCCAVGVETEHKNGFVQRRQFLVLFFDFRDHVWKRPLATARVGDDALHSHVVVEPDGQRPVCVVHVGLGLCGVGVQQIGWKNVVRYPEVGRNLVVGRTGAAGLQAGRLRQSERVLVDAGLAAGDHFLKEHYGAKRDGMLRNRVFV